MTYTLSNPVDKIKPGVIYFILTFTGVLNLLIIDFSYSSGVEYFKDFSLIDLELAGNIARANTILAYWDSIGALRWFYFHLGLDYLFIVCYTLFLFFACHHSAIQVKKFTFLSYLGLVIGWLQPLAGMLDVIENQALAKIVAGTTDEVWAQLAQWCAMPKFAIALSGMAYIVLAITVFTYSIALSRIRHA